jgi:flagellar assembly protein FliH
MSDVAIITIPVLDAQPITRGFRPLTHPTAMTGVAGAASLNPGVSSKPEEDMFARGLAEGQHLAQCAFEIERAQFRILLAGVQALQPEPSEELAVLIAETVDRLVADIVGETRLHDDQLMARARKAANLISECDSARTIWVHPDDVDALASCDLSLQLMPDPEAEHGSVRIDCSSGWIEHGTSLYLRELRAQLGLKEGDQ